MKLSFKKLLCTSLALLMLIGFGGCSTIVKEVEKKASEKKTENVVKSTDGKTQITVYSDWKEDKQLNGLATLQVSNRLKEKYVVVISESPQDFSADIKIDEFAELVKQNISQSAENATVSEIKDMSISGVEAKFFDIQGEVNKVKAHYIVAAVKGKNALHQVISWTLNSKFDENKEELKKVVQSFKEL